MKFHRFARYALILWSVATLLTPTVWARQASVTLKDGRQLSGELISETPQTVTLQIAGIATPISRDQIQAVQYIQSVNELYAQRRAKIARDDIEGRYQLARWLFDQKALELARKELLELQAQAPDHNQTKLLLRVVEERIKLSNQPTTDPSTPVDPSVKVPTSPLPAPKISTEALDQLSRLNEEQINLIRLYEIDLTVKPRVVVPREVVDTVLKDYADKPGVANFRTAQGYEQLATIISIGADSLYPKITVRDDPPSMRNFRSRIHQNYVLSYCATAQCHGGPNSGKLFIFPDRPNDETTIYTNFLILSNYSDDNGYMIDRSGKIEDSLLLQYALPRATAKSPHPDVPHWRPLINNDRDQRYKLLTDWMRELNPRRKTYPNIIYQAPRYPSSTKPAQTQPIPPVPPAPPSTK